MKLYLDNCCLHRPFDDQAEPRIHMEAEAVKTMRNSLGVVGLIRFIQQYDKGQGNYTLDRQTWQQSYSVDSLFAAIKG